MTKGKVVDKTGWHYTIVENAIHDTELLNIYEKAIYFALKRFANIQTNESFPGVKKLAAISRMSERKARDTIRELEKKEIINVLHRDNDTSIYTILPTPAQYAGGASHAGDLRHDMQHPPAHDADELKRTKLKRIELDKDSRQQQAADTKKKPKVYDEQSAPFLLAELLYKRILRNNPDHKKPNLQKWADDFRKLIEIDGRHEKEIQEVIVWTQKDEFEMVNVLSAAKLRERYDNLKMKMWKAGGGLKVVSSDEGPDNPFEKYV